MDTFCIMQIQSPFIQLGQVHMCVCGQQLEIVAFAIHMCDSRNLVMQNEINSSSQDELFWLVSYRSAAMLFSLYFFLLLIWKGKKKNSTESFPRRHRNARYHVNGSKNEVQVSFFTRKLAMRFISFLCLGKHSLPHRTARFFPLLLLQLQCT